MDIFQVVKYVKEDANSSMNYQKIRSLMVASQALSGGKCAKMSFKHTKVTKRSTYLWSLLRSYVFQSKNKDTFHALLNQVPDVPYPLVLAQGFHYKHALRHSQTIHAVYHHNARLSNLRGVQLEEKGSKDFTLPGLQKTKNKPMTIITVDRTKNITLWDLIHKTAIKPRVVIRLQSEMKDIIFLGKMNVYAACFLDNIIKFYDLNMDPVDEFYTNYPVQTLCYHELSNRLITIGLNQITVFHTSYQVHINLKIIDLEFRNESCQVSFYFFKLFMVDRAALKIDVTMKADFKIPTDEWITDIYLIEKTSTLVIAIDVHILIYDMTKNKVSHALENISKRKITCISYSHFYKYILLGCMDGMSIFYLKNRCFYKIVKVLNVSYAVIHEFCDHPKAITGLSIYHQGHLFLSCSLDKTFRLFSLKTFSLIYCDHLQETPLGIRILNNDMLYIILRDRIEIWTLQHLSSSFLSTSSFVRQFLFYKSPNFPARILVRTDDEVTRVLSPLSTQPITIILPMLENEYQKSIAFCTKSNKIYILRKNGNIWIMSSDCNPCRLLDIWKSNGEIDRENLRVLYVFACEYTRHDEKYGLVNEKGCSLLFGGTSNGQVILFDNLGFISDRYQVHGACIISMQSYYKNHILITSSLDETIRISLIRPYMRPMLDVIIVIETKFIPRNIVVSDGHICASSPDHTLKMYSYNTRKRVSYPILGHERNDDHTNTVSGITSIEKLSLFASVSWDHTLKIWDTNNFLIREIHFHDPIEALAALNSKGDLILGIKDRIEIIKSHQYLPPSYTLAMNKLQWKDKLPEESLTFDTKADPLKSLPLILRRRKRVIPYMTTAHASVSDIMKTLNLYDTNDVEVLNIMKAADNDEQDHSEENEFEEDVYDLITHGIQNQEKKRQNQLNEQYQRSVNKKQFQEQKDLQLHQEFLWADFNKSFIERDNPDPRYSIALGWKSTSHTRLEIPSNTYTVEETLAIHQELLDISLPPVIQKKQHKSLKYRLDGSIANSKGFKPASCHTPIHLKKKKEELFVEDGRASTISNDRKDPSDRFKLRLKLMAEQRSRESKTPELTVETFENTIESKPVVSIDTKETISKVTSKAPSKEELLEPESKAIQEPEPEPEQEQEQEQEISYPNLLLNILQTEWFPKDEILAPPANIEEINETIETVSDPKQKVKLLLKFRPPILEPSPENIIQICLKMFTKRATNIKMDIFKFLKNLTDEQSFQTLSLMSEQYLRELSCCVFKSISLEDITLQFLLMEEMVKIAPDNSNFFPILLSMSVIPQENLKAKAIEILQGYGAHQITAPNVKSILKYLVDYSQRLSVSMDDKIIILYGSITYWLKYHLRMYLLRISSDEKEIKALKEYSLDESDLKTDVLNKIWEYFDMNSKDALDPGSKTEIAKPPDRPIVLKPKSAFKKLSMIIKNPSNQDYAKTINFYGIQTEKVIILREKERDAIKAKALEEAKKAEMERLKQLKLAEAKASKERERLAVESLKQAKLDQIKAKMIQNQEKRNQKRPLPVKKAKLPEIDLTTRQRYPIRKSFCGPTSISKCHPSREQLNGAYWTFPRLESGPKASTSLSLHYATFNKSLAIDHITLDPFKEEKPAPKMRQETQENNNNEMHYPSIGRKYFIPRLAVAWDQIE